jgi:hypothetical protein
MIDISKPNQCESIEKSIKASLYEAVLNTSKNTQWIRLGGLPLGIAAGILTIAKRVACIVEEFFKGLANIFGCLIFDECSFVRGLKHLGESVIHIVILPFSVGSAVFGVFQHTIMIAIAPVKFSDKKLSQHRLDNNAKSPKDAEEENFRRAQERYVQDHTNTRTINYLAYAYHEGVGVEQDLKQAFLFDKKSAELGNVSGMYNLAISYLKGEGTEQDLERARFWLTEAVKLGCEPAQEQLQKLQELEENVSDEEVEEVDQWSDEEVDITELLNRLGNQVEIHNDDAEEL